MKKNKNKTNTIPTQELEAGLSASKQKSVRKISYVKPELKKSDLHLKVTSGKFAVNRNYIEWL